MDQTTIYLWLLTAGGVICSLSGLMFLGSPQVIHKLNLWIGRSLVSFDGAIVKHNRFSGVMFLAVGIFLLYMTMQAR